MKSLTYFNNKGGVGKTTLCCNLSSFFAQSKRMNVLLVDCDSSMQLNATCFR